MVTKDILDISLKNFFDELSAKKTCDSNIATSKAGSWLKQKIYSTVNFFGGNKEILNKRHCRFCLGKNHTPSLCKKVNNVESRK